MDIKRNAIYYGLLYSIRIRVGSRRGETCHFHKCHKKITFTTYVAFEWQFFSRLCGYRLSEIELGHFFLDTKKNRVFFWFFKVSYGIIKSAESLPDGSSFSKVLFFSYFILLLLLFLLLLRLSPCTHRKNLAVTKRTERQPRLHQSVESSRSERFDPERSKTFLFSLLFPKTSFIRIFDFLNLFPRSRFFFFFLVLISSYYSL